jgi:hypothetical protein
MQRSFWFTCIGVALAGTVLGQMKKQFTVEDAPACENIRLHLKANSGNCFIKPSQNPEILNVFSNQDEASFSHDFRKEIKGHTCEVSLNLEEAQSAGISHSISANLWGSDKEDNDRIWKMYLSEAKPYVLELNYGVGNANIDLSGLSIKKLKINTGSANVNVGYSSMENQVDMDTFYVKVDLGSVNVRNLNLSRTRYMLADVGFGSMQLDFSDRPLVSNTIKGSVGAGNLTILLPIESTAVMVKIHESWLCSVKLPKSLKKINDTTYANSAYTKDPSHALTFDLDVSMGSITFKEVAVR